ncbi:hypothetical protein ASPZODRAFT_56064 [Penicilliopsis zonata CBS 506.65]|uniref:Uncharacterized protein n=1 Tax=Penicilliopsis zonata CBS 506.65 TaxID=1073090 RepID=A0A1L9SVT4_9EURO|nr:hypothetical protein ASPZODRAFT_56064 [Penicilliopsis zonata CBS 506.65]OJJ51298.1 hypothetical protein ASPZODRAFT_56064 [Penicilliopsis zonata CBS 506.65]
MPATACFASTVLPEVYVEPKAGMIRIIGPVVRDLLKHITRRIHEGPLLEIRQESRESVLVTFLHATHAMAFLHSSDEMEKTCGSSRIGHGYKIEMVETADWKEEHLRMNQPLRERRRLSFARKKMFSEGMNPTRWEHDIHRLVGSMNIDFLFVFNSGNATVVFNSTAAARVVHDAFQRWKDVPGAYHGVLVSYSSDPCEKELILVREAPRLSYNRYNRRNAH